MADVKTSSFNNPAPTESMSKSQRQVVWEQFKKHKAALIGGGILVVMYIVTIFAGFLAPYGVNEYRRFPVTAFQPPVTIHWFDAETGRFI